jgi:dimethylamine/trimethylamine dehydrogenase
VLDFGADHVAIATGARWRRDGIGRNHWKPLPGLDQLTVLTPDDIMAGAVIAGPVIVYDDDHYYLGGVLAEHCLKAGVATTLLTPALQPSAYTANTLEATRIARHLARLGIPVVTQSEITACRTGAVTIQHAITGAQQDLACATLLLVTARLPEDALYHAVLEKAGDAPHVQRIGDCLAPAIIQAAVYAGHRFGREIDGRPDPSLLPRELPHSQPLKRF